MSTFRIGQIDAIVMYSMGGLDYAGILGIRVVDKGHTLCKLETAVGTATEPDNCCPAL